VLQPEMTGVQFIRLLRKHNILHSTFAFKANVELSELTNLKLSKEPVPRKYLLKLKAHFSSVTKGRLAADLAA
jgi:hypothetical protein